MSSLRYIAVIDIGKTNAKLALVDLQSHVEVAVRTTPNTVRRDGPYPHFDIEHIWAFLLDALAELNVKTPVEAISITTHGASAALVGKAGDLVLPVLDYEYAGPDDLDADYAAARPAFAESFTPPLPGGLNLGKQLFWQARRFPDDFRRTHWILPYPQYWGFRLTGVAASEITSIGCHSDLWDFRWDRYSSLVEKEGWSDLFPPLQSAGSVLGPLKPELAQQLGLAGPIPVFVGIHDSNASLLPHVLTRTPPFAVVSTGTWVVVFAPGGDLAHLDAQRDSFSNIDAYGRHVPSARFMGGREYSLMTNNVVREPDEATVRKILDNKTFLLPAVIQGCGPFPDRKAEWSVAASELTPEAHYAVISFYLALMTEACLKLTGAAGDIIVEGPFASNRLYLEMLGAATGRPVLAQQSNTTGTSIGAALLALDAPNGTVAASTVSVASPLAEDMADYARDWRMRVETHEEMDRCT